MAEITTIGLGSCESVFQVHGIDAAGQVERWDHERRSSHPQLAGLVFRLLGPPLPR